MPLKKLRLLRNLLKRRYDFFGKDRFYIILLQKAESLRAQPLL